VKGGLNDFRKALSTNFVDAVFCLLPMAYAHIAPWNKEEEYLNKFSSAIRTATILASKLPLSTTNYRYSLGIDGKKVHKTIWVDFLQKRKRQSCEIGDILIVSKYVDSCGILSRSICFLQVKASNRKKRIDTWKIDRNQVDFYLRWPTIQNCYTGRAVHKHVLLQNLNVCHTNKFFSPYLLLGRNWQPSLLFGPSPWITSVDLVATASHDSGKMQGPLEIPLLSYLIQLLFQTTGERDISNHKTKNANLRQLTDAIFKYVNLNDPPEGEGRPFLVMTFTVKRVEEH
jgi:hypothetical protein